VLECNVQTTLAMLDENFMSWEYTLEKLSKLHNVCDFTENTFIL